MLLANIGLASGSTNLRLISYNIRYATTSPSTGEEPWAVRRPLMASQINFETANRPEALICMQEVLNQQLVDLQSDHGSAWNHVGVGRNDGAQDGEYSPILYQTDTWQLERNKTYWLSETPDVVGSTGWDAALPRIVTVAQFKHRTTGVPLVFMCTHFDHIGTVARNESAKLIIKIADEWKDQGSNSTKPAPVFLGGDLNTEPPKEGYKTLTAPGGFKDIKDFVPKTHWYGNTKTSTSFTTSPSDDIRIDYLFVRDPLDIQFLTYGVLTNKFEDGVGWGVHLGPPASRGRCETARMIVSALKRWFSRCLVPWSQCQKTYQMFALGVEAVKDWMNQEEQRVNGTRSKVTERSVGHIGVKGLHRLCMGKSYSSSAWE